MLTPEQQTEVMNGIRDQLIAAVAEHERDEHGGRVCEGKRAGAVAFFAHCLGVRGRLWDTAKDLLADYDARCDDLNCRHGERT